MFKGSKNDSVWFLFYDKTYPVLAFYERQHLNNTPGNLTGHVYLLILG